MAEQGITRVLSDLLLAMTRPVDSEILEATRDGVDGRSGWNSQTGVNPSQWLMVAEMWCFPYRLAMSLAGLCPMPSCLALL